MASRPPSKQPPRRRGVVAQSPSAPSVVEGPPPVVTPYVLKDDEVERALIVGSDAELLKDYFGEDQLGTLQRLARDANARSLRGGQRVLILPGIMGSKLGFHRELIWDDVIWVDPLDVALGRLKRLALDESDSADIQALGVMLFAYLMLKLRLRSNGFDADFHPFDWRQDIDHLGKQLAARIESEAKPVHLVAHSMGGLVARAALASNPANLRRIVTLGTPNFGSYSPIQAFRGVHSIARKLARLDLTATQDELGDIFKTFPGLCEMFPGPQTGVDYYSLAFWPKSGVLPSETILATSKATLGKLPVTYKDLFQIIGCNKETIVAAEIDKERDEFVYTATLDGDGTVPLTLARLPDRPTYFIAEEHGNLANNETVAKAVVDILNTGKTTALPQDRPATRSAIAKIIPEHALQPEPTLSLIGQRGGGGRRAAGAREARELLQEFASPPSRTNETAGFSLSAADTPLGTPATRRVLGDRVVIGRRHQLRLDVTLALGSITDVDASAYVLGLFSQVSPGGAAKAVDEVMGGAIMEMSDRRMLNPTVGAVSFLPSGRHPVRADLISFVGLGPFDSFKEETLETAAENLIRTLILMRVDDFAMVPFGGSSGVDTGKALEHMMSGFTRGLVDADSDQRFRGVTICELDPDRYRDLQHQLYTLCGTRLFDNVEVTLREKRLVLPERSLVTDARSSSQLIYLIVRQDDQRDGKTTFVSSLLTAGDKATTFPSQQEVELAELEKHLEQIKVKDGQIRIPSLPEFGNRLGELVLSPDMRQVLSRFTAQHLVVVHDAKSSRIPWETLHIGGDALALAGGLSHRYEARDLSTAKWLQQRKLTGILKVLLVVDPTGDLENARREGERIASLMGGLGAATVEPLIHQQATREALIKALTSGKYDVVHYAGHAFFDESNPERSGLLCFNRQVLSGNDLASLANLPSLMFFNACEAARIRRMPDGEDRLPSMSERLQRGSGFAEALLRGGLANYVGTYWPVKDDAAEAFATTFYQSLLLGKPLGSAIMEARHVLKGANMSDWADYVLYGDPNFVLKPILADQP